MLLLSLDGCNNYKVLSDASRAQGNKVQTSLARDHYLELGWYRFQGAAGDRMADQCVPMGRCGVVNPGWINGAHPTVAEGVVTRKVCYTSGKDCRSKENIVKVKNCGSYYVYELQKYIRFDQRYCGNGGAGKLHSIPVVLNRT